MKKEEEIIAKTKYDSLVSKKINIGETINILPKKKIMLVLPNHNWATRVESPTMWILWPTQLCLLAAQIEDKYDVKIVDCIIDNISEKDFAEIVRKEKQDLV